MIRGISGILSLPLRLLNRRMGCLIIVLLTALLFVFWGMLCRLTVTL